MYKQESGFYLSKRKVEVKADSLLVVVDVSYDNMPLLNDSTFECELENA